MSQFTLANTARATHTAKHGAGLREEIAFYDMSNTPVMYLYAENAEWRESRCTADDIKDWDAIELSRPESDIDALFDGAPDVTISYAKFKSSIEANRYWLCVNGYWLASGEDNEFYPFGEEGPGYMNFKESDFEIIATRQSVPVKAVVSIPKPLSTVFVITPDESPVIEEKPLYTQTMKDNEQLPPVGSFAVFARSDFEIYNGLVYGLTVEIINHLVNDGIPVAVFKHKDTMASNDCFDVAMAGNESFDTIDTRTDKEKAFDKSVESLAGYLGELCPMPDIVNKMIEWHVKEING